MLSTWWVVGLVVAAVAAGTLAVAARAVRAETERVRLTHRRVHDVCVTLEQNGEGAVPAAALPPPPGPA